MKEHAGIIKRAAAALGLLLAATAATAQNGEIIRISTDHTDLVMQVGPDGHLYQTYLGEKLLHEGDLGQMDLMVYPGAVNEGTPRGHEVASAWGGYDLFEPALSITHSDGNPTTALLFTGAEETPLGPDATLTRIFLRDEAYPLEVTLNYVAFPALDVIKTWSEIRHSEPAAVTLQAYATTMLYLRAPAYYLTQFAADWAREGQMTTERLHRGKKVSDSRLGTRPAQLMEPFFELGLGAPPAEEAGQVLLGTLAWTGNFRFTFEVDNLDVLRLLAGANPEQAAYPLEPGEVFVTPQFVFTLSDRGVGAGSRRLADWARQHQLKKGTQGRRTLLNNWESTYFDFDQESLGALMRQAGDLGVDMFLLDDGWFGNRHPRSNDRAGLGDWQPTAAKLPGGIKALTDSATAAGVLLGLWIEPEMVNEASDLYERHPDWVMRVPGRRDKTYRHQMVLDMANPQVQDYVFSVVDTLMTQNPSLAYLKWDCNSTMLNQYSPHAGPGGQGRLFVDYVRGLYNVLGRVAAKYPELQMMLCSSGGARCDYGALRYFVDFWCSDDTDPVERVYIQWALSQFFPAKAMASHVTDWRRDLPLKFRADVASMCRLGFDLDLAKLSEDERQFARQAVQTWRELAPAVMEGDLYRLLSPYEGNHAALDYVSKDKALAVLFAYDLHPRYGEPLDKVRLRGLDPEATYLVEEVNLMPGEKPTLRRHGQALSGDYLHKVGLDVLSASQQPSSRVVRLKKLP